MCTLYPCLLHFLQICFTTVNQEMTYRLKGSLLSEIPSQTIAQVIREFQYYAGEVEWEKRAEIGMYVCHHGGSAARSWRFFVAGWVATLVQVWQVH